MDQVGLDAEDARWLRRATSSVASEEKALALVVGEAESLAFSPTGVPRRIATGPRVEFGRFFSNQVRRKSKQPKHPLRSCDMCVDGNAAAANHDLSSLFIVVVRDRLCGNKASSTQPWHRPPRSHWVRSKRICAATPERQSWRLIWSHRSCRVSGTLSGNRRR